MPYERVKVDKRLKVKDITEIKRLYLDEGLTFQQVGDRVGLTRQAVHDRLRRAGIKSRPVKRLERDTLLRLYVAEELSIAETAARLGVSSGVVGRELGRHAIDRRPAGSRKRKPIDRDLLQKLYVTDGLTQIETAAKLGVGHNTLRRDLRHHKITFRHKPPGTSKLKPKRFEYEVLYKLYVEERKSCPQVGQELDAGENVIRYWLKRNGIERRPSGSPPSLIDRDVLYQLYIAESLTYKQLAATLGRSPGIIWKHLKSHGLLKMPRRQSG